MKNLSDLINANATLTEYQKDDLFGLLAGRSRGANRAKLLSRISNVPLSLWSNYGIYQRVQIDADGSFSYCAGQDYPGEIAYIRKLIIEG